MEGIAAHIPKRYEPKRFGKSSLYRILVDYWDEFTRVYEQRFERLCGSLRSVVERVVDRFIDCGNPLCGFARIRCENCKKERIRPFSCKTRGFCNSCQARFATEWGIFLVDKLLEPVPHRHMVFTLPKILRTYFRYDRKLINDLSRAAYKSVTKYAEYMFGNGGTLGMIAVRQHFGEAARHHPHIHVLLAEGVWNNKREFIPLFKIDAAMIQQCFEVEVFRFLRHKGLLSKERMELIKSWHHSGFGVYLDRSLYPEDKEDMMRLARYLLRAPIALDRIDYDRDKGIVNYSTDKFGVLEIDVLDFIARLSIQVPDPYERLLVYYGLYSNASALRKQIPVDKSDNEKEKRQVESCDKTKVTGKLRSKKYWARLIEKIWLTDPMLCPSCGGKCRVISFITQFSVIDKILKHIGYHHKDLPKPLYRGPPCNGPPKACKNPLG